ncbi:YaaL family protein [Evansella sp. AB-P1]|uniref:YaaL family protein n=1 Tax=Evansella sp. AB-P1 TaxID=3037653 RepID=UPI00241F0E33|nr:YaaL family protein [Evansella sp. AB-P1]MDG5790107.1 YaaL family protein [Evansella sp. AB-P1]
MIFRKKGKIRKREDDSLLWYLQKMKSKVNHQEALINNSVDYHSNVMYNAKLEKMKYMFLLKEARIRKTGLKVNKFK